MQYLEEINKLRAEAKQFEKMNQQLTKQTHQLKLELSEMTTEKVKLEQLSAVKGDIEQQLASTSQRVSVVI